MTPYVVRLIPQSDITLFENIRDAVHRLPDIDLGTDEAGKKVELSCHMLARAVGKVFPVSCIDGYFYPHYQHSWIRTVNWNIIDVYPVGILGGPILVDGNIIYAPGKFLYLRKNTTQISQGRFSKASFRRAVREIMRILADVARKE